MAMLEKKIIKLSLTDLGARIFGRRERELALFEIKAQDFYGLAEYAPYPGIHEHSVADLVAEADKISASDLQEISKLDYSTDYLALDQCFKKFPSPMSYVLSMAHFFNGTRRLDLSQQPVPLAALILRGALTESVSEASFLVAQGFKTLKIKIGSLAIEDEIKKIKAIAKIGGAKIALRIDANGALNYSEAELLFKSTRRLNIEYFEEPLKDFSSAQKYARDYDARLAMDENYLPGSALEATDFVIIKPSRFASVYGAMDIFLQARKKSITPILSHCFESDISTACFLKMAQVLGAEKNAHGIMPVGVFKQGVLNKPLRACRGYLT